MTSNYKVRSRDIVDLVNDINFESLILSPYFQRKLVWRLTHKVDFINTILKGFPFPEIFISRGSLDVETMKSTSCIVDGQQRMSTIREFLKDGFEVDGKKFSDLVQAEKEQFLKYAIAIIDLDMNQDDPELIEIFKRLNRTFYALSNIEKLSTEYGSSEFMLVAKMICGEFMDEEEHPDKNVAPGRHTRDPNITADFTKWANEVGITAYTKLLLDSEIFTKYEVSRQVHLMFTLNLMATMKMGFYARNEQVVLKLDEFASDFDSKDEIVDRINHSAEIFNKIAFPKTSPWYSKSNAFSLLLAINKQFVGKPSVTPRTLRTALSKFIDNAPDDYALAAREAVNNKRQRALRDQYIIKVLKAA